MVKGPEGSLEHVHWSTAKVQLELSQFSKVNF